MRRNTRCADKDLRSGDDFTDIRIRLETDADPTPRRETVVAAPASRDLTLGYRVAEFGELAVGSYIVSVVLEDAAGAEVASWRSSVPLSENLVVTALVTRTCIGVTCPGAGDAPNQTTCFGGQCVNEDCANGVSGACDRPEVPLSSFLERVLTIACEMGERCGGAAFYIATKDADCTEQYRVRTEDLIGPLIVASVIDGTLIYHPASGQACLDALLASCRSAAITKEHLECVAAFQGTVATGGSCRSHFDCVGLNTFCDFRAACPGVCRERLSVGSRCFDEPSCEAQLVCFENRCAREADVGEPCGAGIGPCPITALCIRGTCLPIDDLFVGATGDPCDGTAGCREPLSCSLVGAEQRCTMPVGAGSPCYIAVPDLCRSTGVRHSRDEPGSCAYSPSQVHREPHVARGADTKARTAPLNASTKAHQR